MLPIFKGIAIAVTGRSLTMALLVAGAMPLAGCEGKPPERAAIATVQEIVAAPVWVTLDQASPAP